MNQKNILKNIISKQGTATEFDPITDAEIDEMFGTAAGTGTNAQDYVIEHGTSGNWTYEKWASGKAVCRCRVSGTIECKAQWGVLYTTGSNTVSATYPTNFFIDVPNVQYSFETTGYNYWAIAGSSGGTKDHTPVLQLARPTESQIVYMVNWEATGKWK